MMMNKTLRTEAKLLGLGCQLYSSYQFSTLLQVDGEGFQYVKSVNFTLP
jgi:hypothetical protein